MRSIAEVSMLGTARLYPNEMGDPKTKEIKQSKITYIS